MAATGISNSPPSDDRTASAADGLIRRLGARYLFVLITVALLIVVDQAILQPLLIRLDRYAPAINLSGRQRMLSQKLTKAALALERHSSEKKRAESRNELQETLAQWTSAHTALREGDEQRGIYQIQSAKINEQWKLLEPHYVAMSAAAQELIDERPSSNKDSAVEIMVTHEGGFLAAMDRIVKLMEGEAAREVQQLRALALAIAAMIVTLLIGLGWFVIRPATRTIRRQVDQLESRVAERTAELATTLHSLQHEIDEREKVEAKNQRLATQLAHADRVESIGHLAVGLAHELNHPLGAIANYAEACDVILGRVERETDHTKLWSFVVQIRQAALRAGQIVRRMRNFVQPNAAATTDVDLRGLIDEIIALCRPEIERSQTTLSTELEPRKTIVSVDAIQIQQVLVNLVQNALQSMLGVPAAQRRLLIRTMVVADLVQIDVVDSGPGFQSLDPDIIFEPFHTTKTDGLGMGLSICRSIVENHRGTIWAKSSAQQGAIVSFTLPLASVHAASFAQQSDSVCR
ncbi:MAG: ATP-binding protein [Bythopirellula sp.]|nr:ATP-binding protein [Bythopirellula sp.]